MLATAAEGREDTALNSTARLLKIVATRLWAVLRQCNSLSRLPLAAYLPKVAAAVVQQRPGSQQGSQRRQRITARSKCQKH